MTTTLWPLEWVRAPELGEEIEGELAAEDPEGRLATLLGFPLEMDVEALLEIELAGLSLAAQRVAVQRVLVEAETVDQPPAADEARNGLGRPDSGALDGASPDPRGWRSDEDRAPPFTGRVRVR